MNVLYLTSTLVTGWNNCPLAAWLDHERRVEHGDDMMGTVFSRFGTITHEVAEKFHRAIMRDEDPGNPKDLFLKVWASHKLTEPEWFALGDDKIEEFLERTIFDRGGTTIGAEVTFVFDIDPQDPKDRLFVLHPTPKEVASTCENIIQRGGVPYRSTIDRIDAIETSDESTWYEVTDYKTNMQPFTRDEVDDSLQLFAYSEAVKRFYPDADHVLCTYDMVRHGRFSTVFDEAKSATLRRYIRATWEQIRNTAEPWPQLNSFCKWCEYKKDCPVYAEALDPDVPDWDINFGNVEEIYAEYERLKNIDKIVQGRIEDLGVALIEEIKQNKGRPVPYGEEREIYLQPNPRYEYNMREVWKILKKSRALSLLVPYINMSRSSLDRALRERPDLREATRPHEVTRFVKPTLKTRTMKTEKPKKKRKK